MLPQLPGINLGRLRKSVLKMYLLIRYKLLNVKIYFIALMQDILGRSNPDFSN